MQITQDIVPEDIVRSFLSGFGPVVCLCFGFLFTCSGGVPADTSFTVQLRWLQSPWNLPTALQRQCTDHLERWLQSRGIAIADNSDQILWCDVYTFEGPDSENVVLSVGVGRALPAKLIEFGTKTEILYAGVSAEKKAVLPKNGKKVRESLSKDFLSEFMRPTDHELVIVSKSHLFERLNDVMEHLYLRQFKR
jgi:hypothetical protein